MDEDAKYLEDNIRSIIQPLIHQILINNPENPIPFMIDYLKKYLGISTTNEINPELEELKTLRKEIIKYKNKFGIQDPTIESKSPNKSNKESNDNQENKSNNSSSFDSGNSKSKSVSESNLSSDENDNEIMKEKQETVNQLTKENIQKILQKKQTKRCSVSAEAYGKYNIKQVYIPRIIPKSSEEKENLRKKFHENFLFSNLNERELNIVIDAIEKKTYSSNNIVIKEGDRGDTVYIVEEGTLSCTKIINGENKKVHKDYISGDSFGELALMYNCPRAATITALTDCVLWALDRECFNNIIKEVALKRKEMFEDTLKKVDILSSFDKYEIGNMCDAFTRKEVKAGTKIISQNEEGDSFFIIEYGEAYATKLSGDGEVKVMDYCPGGYFGELALLKNAPRAASVYAKTDCSLLIMERKAFKRLFGPLEEVLLRNSEQYVKYVR